MGITSSHQTVGIEGLDICPPDSIDFGRNPAPVSGGAGIGTITSASTYVGGFLKEITASKTDRFSYIIGITPTTSSHRSQFNITHIKFWNENHLDVFKEASDGELVALNDPLNPQMIKWSFGQGKGGSTSWALGIVVQPMPVGPADTPIPYVTWQLMDCNDPYMTTGYNVVGTQPGQVNVQPAGGTTTTPAAPAVHTAPATPGSSPAPAPAPAPAAPAPVSTNATTADKAPRWLPDNPTSAGIMAATPWNSTYLNTKTKTYWYFYPGSKTSPRGYYYYPNAGLDNAVTDVSTGLPNSIIQSVPKTGPPAQGESPSEPIPISPFDTTYHVLRNRILFRNDYGYEMPEG